MNGLTPTNPINHDEQGKSPVTHGRNLNNNNIFFFKAGTSIIKIDFNLVDYILASGNYSKVVMEQKHIIISVALKEIEDVMNTREFIRIHRSCIVAIKKIEKIKDHLAYINNVTLPIGKMYRNDFYNAILTY
jgi:DNA-binding LytR/AlgR family response regulator